MIINRRARRDYRIGDEYEAGRCNAEDAIGHPTPVGSYPRGVSPHGCYDMAGNVFEWCADRFGPDYYKKDENRNPKGPDEGEYRLVRGGSWNYHQDFARCACRGWVRPDRRFDNLGVRFSRTP